MIMLLIMLLALIINGMLCGLVLCKASAPRTPEDQIQEDEEQLEWIRRWREEKE